ncbi:uncharacterized protein LOC110913154 [Helianthus annuus]|uniref:uncharacterized protein LOC110913154 n=1 Tax=Helianthus annuus TaxID=4232 RepID=UPI000B8F25E4|nr:uncharacterized protein LOC110913154 [Helianthus annuus]
MTKQSGEPYVSLEIESERGEVSQTCELPVEGDPTVVGPVTPVSGTDAKNKCMAWCNLAGGYGVRPHTRLGSSPAAKHPAPSRHRLPRRALDVQDGPIWWAPFVFDGFDLSPSDCNPIRIRASNTIDDHQDNQQPDLEDQFDDYNDAEHDMLFGQFADNVDSALVQPPASERAVDDLLIMKITMRIVLSGRMKLV